MTRILITTIPIEGHVRPGIPIARSLAEEGHDVAWYTGRKFERLVTGTGARFMPVSASLNPGGIDILRGLEDKKPGLAGLKRVVTELFIAPVPDYARDLTPILDSFDPDVVVADHCFMAGPLMAAERGIPKVIFSVGPLSVTSVDTAPFGTGIQPSSSRSGHLRNRALMWLVRNVLFRGPQRLAERLMDEMGIDRPDTFLMDWGVHFADRYLQASIPELEHPHSDLPEVVEYVGPMFPPSPPGWSAPAWWPGLAQARRAGRPVVLVTQGTANTELSQLLLPAISALADQDMLVVGTTAGPDPAELMPPARRPANLRLEKFVPFTELLPLTDLMVTNGGFGGVQMALASGVPVVVTGADDDRVEVGARVVRSGAGLSLRTDHPSTDKILRAVRAVLAGDSYRTSAAELKAAYARYRGESRAAEIVVEVARGRQTVAPGQPAG